MFKRDDDTVTLTMTIDEWQGLLLMTGYAIGAASNSDKQLATSFNKLLFKINHGHPDFTPKS